MPLNNQCTHLSYFPKHHIIFSGRKDGSLGLLTLFRWRAMLYADDDGELPFISNGLHQRLSALISGWRRAKPALFCLPRTGGDKFGRNCTPLPSGHCYRCRRAARNGDAADLQSDGAAGESRTARHKRSDTAPGARVNQQRGRRRLPPESSRGRSSQHGRMGSAA